MGDSSVAHGEVRAPSPGQKSSEYLQLQRRGNYNDDLPGRYLPARRANLDPIGEKTSAFSSLVDSRPILPTHAARGCQQLAQQLGGPILAFLQMK